MFVEALKKYDGTLIHSRFAYNFFRDQCSPLGNMIIFRGPMEVLAEGMLDREDSLREDFIWSDDAINILWEIPALGNSAFGAVAYQRLLNTLIAEILAKPAYLNLPIQMKGDDIMVCYEEKGQAKLGKCSVSITHVKNNAALGHTGINITAGSRAPGHAYSTNLTDKQIASFAKEVMNLFASLNQNMFIATAKII